MSLSYLLVRSRRKVESDGFSSLAGEVFEKGLESSPLRNLTWYRVCRSTNVMDRDELLASAAMSWTYEAHLPIDPQTEVAIPRKRRLPRRNTFAGLEERVPPPPCMVELRDVTVLGPFGLGITSDGQFIKDTVAGPRQSRSRIEKILCRSLGVNGPIRTYKAVNSPNVDPDRSLDAAGALIPVWKNYYHWLLECLPKVLGFDIAQQELGVTPTILVPEHAPPWVRESLKLAGVDRSRIAACTGGVTHVDRFYVPTYPEPSRLECVGLRQRMRDNLTDHITGTRQELPERIFVSRQNANVRRIKNWNEVTRVLNRYDIVPYALEEHSVKEQIRLFTSANLVVGPHGAGLANIVFGNDCTVFELFGHKQKTTFYRLAKVMGLEYHAMFANHERRDIVIDIPRLEAKLQGILNGEEQPILEADQTGIADQPY